MVQQDDVSLREDEPPPGWLGQDDDERWAAYRHRAGFSLQCPAHWRVEDEDGYFHFSPRLGFAHLFVSAFTAPIGALREFAMLKFGAHSELFRACEPPRPVEGPGWTGLFEQADDVRAEREGATRRMVLCASGGTLYVSLSLYLDSDDFVQRRRHYETIFSSLTIEA